MSLFGTIYLGKSGINTMSRGLSVSADNVANLESTGFRASRALFEDLMLRATNEAPPGDQRGLGTTVEAVEVLYHEGPIKVTDNPTDLAITGKGFFTVSDGEDVFYTRDGGFILREVEDTLRLSTPSGYDLYGWAVPQGTDGEAVTSGTLAPVEIPQYISGQPTSNIILQLNCDSSRPPETTNLTLLDKWDGTQEEPISSGGYELKVDLPVWDNIGQQHQLSLYLDRTDQARTFEFLVAMDPSEDWRGSGEYAGCLLSGLLHFGSLGDLESIDHLQLITSPSGDTTSLNPGDLPNGLPAFTVNFTGTPQQITLDFGLYFDADAGQWQRVDNRVSTAFAAPFSVIYQYLDGYPPGTFKEIKVSEKGVVQAKYTNNQIFDMARIPLALFGSPDDLERAGANLFKAVAGAEPDYFAPDRNAVGTIIGGALEDSNVDLAQEMVHLITLQRAFQSNTRIITTADQMLDDFIRSV